LSIDYIVTSLPTLRFDEPAPISWEKFCEVVGADVLGCPQWTDLETQMKNEIAEARNGARFARPVEGCSLYWKKRVLDCFAEKDVLKRNEMLDRVWWDAAGELTPPTAPLGKGALATYAVRLKIALKRSLISQGKGNAAPNGGIPGDIHVFVEEEPHKELVRDGQNLIYQLLLDVPTAVLGGNVEVPTIDGKISVKVDPGTQPGKTMRVRGKGLPAVQGYGYGMGDLIIQTSVYIPETLSKDEKEKFESLRNSDNMKPGSTSKETIFSRFKKMFE